MVTTWRMEVDVIVLAIMKINLKKYNVFGVMQCVSLRLFAAASAAFLSANVVSAAKPKPNVLFICIDDLVPTLGCYGDTFAKTPQIDKLASRGTTFLHHECVWPVCGPSRVALSTGLTPEETGVTAFRGMRAKLPNLVTLPQHFHNNGYVSACAGKFHDPRTTGDFHKPKNKNGQFPGGKKFDDRLSWSIPFIPHPHDIHPAGHPAVDNSNHAESEYVDYKILQQGLGLLKKIKAGGKPFFLTVGFKKPHLPFFAPRKYWNLYKRNEISLAEYRKLPVGVTKPNAAALKNNSEILGYDPYTKSGLPTEAQQRELIHGYYACASWADHLTGELLRALAATDDPVQKGKKMSETTIVVLWGDHGFHLGDHGRWAKHTNMERAAFCPLIIFDPRNPTAGAKTESPASTLDIYPTLCQMAGIPIPEQPLNAASKKGRPLRGVSLVPVLKDPKASVRVGAITMFKSKGSYGYALRSKRYRYIEWISKKGKVVARDLYDYKEDPLETKNLAADPAYRATVKKLAEALHADPFAKGATRLKAVSGK